MDSYSRLEWRCQNQMLNFHDIIHENWTYQWTIEYEWMRLMEIVVEKTDLQLSSFEFSSDVESQVLEEVCT